MEIIPTTLAVGLIVALIGILGVFQVHRYLGRRDAAATFRAAIDPAVFSGLRGNDGRQPLRSHQLHGALIRVFPRHLAAAHEFRRYLGPIDRWRFSRAWKTYHGGDEKHPDWFVRYCWKANGPQLLKSHLDALRNAASQT